MKKVFADAHYWVAILNDQDQSHAAAEAISTAIALFKARPDKGYRLTDCISMLGMRQESITDILTHDSHFTQEGFTILL